MKLIKFVRCCLLSLTTLVTEGARLLPRFRNLCYLLSLPFIAFNFKMKCNVKCVEQRRTLPKGHQQSKKRNNDKEQTLWVLWNARKNKKYANLYIPTMYNTRNGACFCYYIILLFASIVSCVAAAAASTASVMRVYMTKCTNYLLRAN